MSMFWNAGVLPRPGIRCISPHSATTNPAPTLGHQAAHRQDEAGGPVAQQGIVRQRQVRLGHADGRGAQAQLLDPLQVLARLRLEVDAGRAVELRGDGLDLLHDRRAGGRQEVERVRLVARRDDGVGQVHGAGASVGEPGVHDHGLGAGLERQLLDQRGLGRRVGREAVDRHDARQPVLPDDLHVRRQVVGALPQRIEILGARGP